MSKIYAALKIGTTRTVLAVGEASDRELKVIHLESIPSAGVRKSQILDINQATQSVRGILAAIERKEAKSREPVDLYNANLVISGTHVQTDHLQAQLSVDGSRVTDRDLAEISYRAHEHQLPPERELLDIAEQDYLVDDHGGILSPKAMSCRVLRLNTLQIYGEKARLEDARTAAQSAHLEIEETLFSATCAAEAVLDDTDRREGVLLLDLGGGTTGYTVHCDGYLAAAGSLGVGGDHLTNDIAQAFQTTQAQAEELKLNYASAILGGDSNRVTLSGSSPMMETRSINRRSLNLVVNARVKELLAMVRSELETDDLLPRLRGGVILTGGGAYLNNLLPLVEHELGLAARIGRPLDLTLPDGLEHPAAYASVLGALVYARRNDHEKPLLPFLSKFFRK